MKEFKILSLQTFSLYANGGGSRILRRLYLGHENRVVSIAIVDNKTNHTIQPIKELAFTKVFSLKKWMRWRLRLFLMSLREQSFFINLISNKIINAIVNIEYDVVHVVDHGLYSGIALNSKILKDKLLWVSFHDCFAPSKKLSNQTKQFWLNANRRLVISKELGDYYSNLFGKMPYEIITDGVLLSEICETPKDSDTKEEINIYFSGLLHVGYYELFYTLSNALDVLSTRGFKFNLVLRGTQHLDFLYNRKFKVEYRPFTLNVDELKEEQDYADILYLPIKFTDERFYLYSLSTKMVGYLSSPGVILYHGPDNSAACNLLKKQNAALCISSLKTDILIEAILELNTNKGYSTCAKKIAINQFNLSLIQKKFWQV